MLRSFSVAGIVIGTLFVHCQASFATLTGQYLFEEGAGTTALDSSGFGRNGTLANGAGTGGPTYTAGLYKGSNSALLFKQALNDRVALPQNQSFIRNAPGATLMAWVRYDSPLPYNFDTQIFPIIVQVNDGTTVDIANGTDGSRASITDSHNYFFRSVAGQNSEPDTGLNSVPGSCQNDPELCTVTGRTYFVVGVFDYVNRSNSIYIDGELANTTAPFPIPSWNGGNSDDKPNLFATIGANPSPSASTQFSWDGALDGVRIFNTALDATTILNIYNTEVKVPVLGDYNGNGIVDAADYALWRKGDIKADGTGPSGTPDGIVNALDYNYWRARFGNTSNPGSGSVTGSALPEPASFALALILGALLWTRRGKPRKAKCCSL